MQLTQLFNSKNKAFDHNIVGRPVELNIATIQVDVLLMTTNINVAGTSSWWYRELDWKLLLLCSALFYCFEASTICFNTAINLILTIQDELVLAY